MVMMVNEVKKMKILGMYRNGNFTTTLFSDGTKIRETEENNFIPKFAESMDIKITNQCDMGCPFCHENSTVNGKHGDILNEKFINTLHPYQEVAIGGGDVTSHPDLIPFLRKLKERKIIANITVNQIHFMKKQELIKQLVDEKLIFGLGISLVNPTEEFITLIKQYPNAVIHVINGVLKPEDVAALENNNLKMLILGYKHLRKGNDYFCNRQIEIENNQKWLYDNLSDIISKHKFYVLSFDNLAIEQLKIKKLLPEDEWDEFYMGDDAEFTYYIDMVERKFAKNSTAPMDERYELMGSVDEMFERIRKKN